ncbi:MAG: methionyl-tRNA formyltransferase [Dechloromonas sp.]|nr:methionyl-tRNA formyltransferase [Dechloromonas sp.]
MKLIFAGTPVFAAQALSALIAAGHDITLVLTQPDRPAGRGMALQPSPVKQVALAHGLTVYQPQSLKTPEVQAELAAFEAEAMVVAAYGLILPPAVLALPQRGCLNIHASLLPRWRGAAPIQRALLAGDTLSGVCIMQMEVGLDTGPVLLQRALPIAADETAGSLHDRLASLGADLIVEALAQADWPLRPQASDGVTYAQKIDKAEALIDWQQAAVAIDRQIRAFNPFPGAYGRLAGQNVKLWLARPLAVDGSPGEVLQVDKHHVLIACGQGALAVSELQKAGGKRLPVQQFLAGHPLSVGQRFD